MIRIPLVLLAGILLGACASTPDDSQDAPAPQLQESQGRFFGIFGSRRDEGRSKKVVGRLGTSMEVTPLPVVLSKHRRLNVVLRLSNESKRLVQLDFPTSQRFEILLRESNGRLISTWSEDHAFTQAASVVSINPGERIQYTTFVSTRDLEAGKEYVLEGFFPQYDDLRQKQKFAPVP